VQFPCRADIEKLQKPCIILLFIEREGERP
jgi:hypothetical protein